MKKNLMILIVTMMVAAMVLAGCTPATVENEGQASDKEQKQYVIGMCSANLQEPWNVQMDEDVKNEAAKYDNVTVQFKDAQNDVLTQRAQLEEFIEAGVDGIIISPIETIPLTEPVAAAYQAGIPIIVVGRKVDGDQYTQYIGTDEFSLGYAVGMWMVEKFDGKNANVVELEGLMTSSPGAERHEGFLAAIEGSDINVAFTADAKWLEANGRSEMESALARFDDITAVFGANDPSAHGAYLAAKAVGRENEISFIGIDGLAHEGRVYVADGIFDATIFDATGGDLALASLLKIFAGEEVPKEHLKDAILFEKDTLETGGEIIKLPEGARD